MRKATLSGTPPDTGGIESNQSTQPKDSALSGFTPVFIHSRFDDYGLPAPVFRVYCHIARRAGRDGCAWPSVANIARVCRLHPQTVRKALQTLVAHHFLQSEARVGKSTAYRLTLPAAWRPATHVDDNSSGSGSPQSGSQGTTAKSIQGQPYEANRGKGNPVEGESKKEIQIPHSPPKGDSVKGVATSGSASPEETIYDAYPKKVGKPVALRAITRALGKHSFEFLLERTRLFATTYNGEPRYIPYPSTWFNQERYNDDPSTWRRTPAPKWKVETTARPSRQFRREDYKQPLTNF